MRLLTDFRQRALMSIHSPNRYDNLLGRMELYGMDDLSHAELAEFYLYCCKPKKSLNVQDLAERMAAAFPTLEALVFAEYRDLMKIEGMYRALALRYMEIAEIFRLYRLYIKLGRRVRITGIKDLFSYVIDLYESEPMPATWQICLSGGWDVLCMQEIAQSRAWGEEDAIDNGLNEVELSGAKYVIIVQLDPKAGFRPEKYDILKAKVYAQRLEMFKCRLADVVLYNGAQMWSMFELGKLGYKGLSQYDAAMGEKIERLE